MLAFKYVLSQAAPEDGYIVRITQYQAKKACLNGPQRM